MVQVMYKRNIYTTDLYTPAFFFFLYFFLLHTGAESLFQCHLDVPSGSFSTISLCHRSTTLSRHHTFLCKSLHLKVATFTLRRSQDIRVFPPTVCSRGSPGWSLATTSRKMFNNSKNCD